MPLVIDRRLQNVTDSELRVHWLALAEILINKADAETGDLPPVWAAAYERVRAEFERRGVQLTLWDTLDALPGLLGKIE